MSDAKPGEPIGMRAVSIEGNDAVIVVLGPGAGAGAGVGGGAGAGAAGGVGPESVVTGTTVSEPPAGATGMRIERVSAEISASVRGSTLNRPPSIRKLPRKANACVLPPLSF